MKKTTTRSLKLHRETLRRLDPAELGDAAGQGTLTYEGSCGPTTCPCPSGGRICIE